MEAAEATIVVAAITTIGAIITAFISNRNTKTRCAEHQKELAEQLKRSMSDPREHYFFGKMAHFVTATIPALHEAPDLPEIKLNMMKEFLLIKFQVFVDGMTKWAHDTSEAKLTETTQYICALIREYETTAKARGIPKMFIEKFAIRHEPVVASTVDMIEQIMRSTSYSSNDKENAVLDILLHSFTVTVLSAEQTAKEMNGQLEAELMRLEIETRR